VHINVHHCLIQTTLQVECTILVSSHIKLSIPACMYLPKKRAMVNTKIKLVFP